jgi:uncharacterized protein (TIGR03437 family)
MQQRRRITKIAQQLTAWTLTGITLSMLACVGAQAATPTNTTLTINASGNISGGTTVALAGTASLTNSNIGTGTFTANVDLTTLTAAPSTPTPFTITITSGTTGTLTGTITLANFIGTSGSGSVAVTGGTGNLSGSTGSFPNVSGTLAIGASVSLAASGAGTITIGGGGGTGATPPSISQVLNNYGLVPPGFSNSGIAQGALFIIKGTGLADPNAQALPLQDSTKGLPTTLNGASVKVTVGSTITVPVFYYAIGVQLALVLPSNTPVGTGTVTVTYNNLSGQAPITVVATAMGFDAYYGTGSGLGVATNNATGALYTYTNSIPPGGVAVLWGSGLGPDPARDNTYVGAGFNINNLAHVFVGGLDAQILYQGASGYPGVNQVDVIIPQAVTPGCNVSLVGVTASGVPTNFTTLPIGNGVCSDPAFGITGTQLNNGGSQANVKTGFAGLIHAVQPSGTGTGTTTIDEGFASFGKVSGASYGSSSGSVSIGGCVVSQVVGTGTTGTTTPLDAGNLSVAGPLGNLALSSFTKGTYGGVATGTFIPSTGGTFTFTGTGGADVGSFTAALSFPNPLMTWTNTASNATVTRSSGATVTWSGGGSGTVVSISGSSAAGSNTGSFTCIAPVAAGQFTVPSYILGAMPAGTGNMTVQNQSAYVPFTASGLDYGFMSGWASQQINVVYN